jgi:hypothetical protein
MRFWLFILFISACSQAPVSQKTEKEARRLKQSPYPRVEAGVKRACWVTQELNDYETRYIFDCSKKYSPSNRLFAGFGFKSKGRHPFTSKARSPYGKGKVLRTIDMISRNQALNETYLHVIDFAGGPDSHDPKSVIYLFPRVEIPRISQTGDQLQLTLPTGEKAYIDADTGAVKGGALKEGPLDLNRNYKNRRSPNVHYTGDYVSVRLTHSYEEPTVAARTAIVRQKDNICELPRSTLFGRSGKLLTQSDEDFLEVINQECPVRFEY